MAAIPVREGVKALSDGLPAPTLTRHSWRGKGRAWIEVRGLDGPGGAELGRAVVDAVLARPGVTSASINRPLSRIVVSLYGDQTSLRELCRVVDEAEKQWRRRRGHTTCDPPARKPLPGDGLLLATKAVGVGATAAGLGVAVAGRVLRWPRPELRFRGRGGGRRLPAAGAPPARGQHRPIRDGHAADLAMAAAHVIELSPASLAVDLMMETLKAAEMRAEAQAWSRHEPRLARHAEHAEVHPPSRPVPPPEGPIERHSRRSALLQAIGVAAVGAATRNLDMASTAALVTTPKATRTTRESFAAALGQGLADHHAVLAVASRKACAGWTGSTRCWSIPGCCVPTRCGWCGSAVPTRTRFPRPGTAPSCCWRNEACVSAGTRFPGCRPAADGRRSTDRPHARSAGLGCTGRGTPGRPGFDLCRHR